MSERAANVRPDLARGAVDVPVALRARGVELEYPAARALSDVSLELRSGEAVALIGPSGAGKTSLLRLLNGMETPTSGSVETLGCDLGTASAAQLRQVRAGVGSVSQDLGLIPTLRVSQNVIAGRLGRFSLARSLRHMLWPSRQTLREVHAVLERVGIGDKLFEPAARLSGGEQQRVAIARALYQRPRVLLADEPVASVDPARARQTLERLLALSREDSLTLCVSLHQPELARALFPRVVGLRAGRVVFDRAAAELRDADLEALYALEPAREPLHGT
ncbi:MAG: ATP-binding cassette domain-containing protein [Proteobacteria bacterium]|nr:ATP-binding cassette domain-containing protein [Pseudomonadota bacterium]